MHIAFLHTSDLHIATFDALLRQRGFGGDVSHRVAPVLLEKARSDGIGAVQTQVAALLEELADADVVICSCSTLGPVVDRVSEEFQHIFRGDRPVMQAACQNGGNIALAICLESTEQSTCDMLQDCAKAAGRDIAYRLIRCHGAWPYFEAGDMKRFAVSIAETIRADILAKGAPDCLVLAQASMRYAKSYLEGPHLEELGVDPLAVPDLAVDHALSMLGFRASPKS